MSQKMTNFNKSASKTHPRHVYTTGWRKKLVKYFAYIFVARVRHNGEEQMQHTNKTYKIQI